MEEEEEEGEEEEGGEEDPRCTCRRSRTKSTGFVIKEASAPAPAADAKVKWKGTSSCLVTPTEVALQCLNFS